MDLNHSYKKKNVGQIDLYQAHKSLSHMKNEIYRWLFPYLKLDQLKSVVAFFSSNSLIFVEELLFNRLNEDSRIV